MLETETKEIKIYELLENPAFQRYAGCFEDYQALLQTNKKDKKQIEERMRSIHLREDSKKTQNNEKKSKSKNINNIENNKTNYDDIARYALATCEKNKFKKDNFAKWLSKLGVIEDLLSIWEIKKGIDPESKMIYENEIISYKDEGDKTISIHISPNSIKSNELIPKLLEGFKLIAKQIKEGKIQVDNIVMKSWLLNTAFEPKIKALFGGNLSLQDTEESDPDIEGIRIFALMYNRRSLDNFLKTGEQPPVRQVTLKSSEFVHSLGF